MQRVFPFLLSFDIAKRLIFNPRKGARIGVLMMAFCYLLPLATLADRPDSLAQAEIDSLNQLILPGNPDTTRAVAYGYLSRAYFKVQLDTVIPVCEEGIRLVNASLPGVDLVSEERLKTVKSSLLNNIGFAYYRMGQLNEATESWFQVLEMKEQMGLRPSMPHTYNNLGNAYCDLGNMESAKLYFGKALEIAQEFNDSLNIARSYNNFGYVDRLAGDLGSAISAYRSGLEIRTEMNDSVGIATGLNNIGYVHLQEEQYDSVLYYMERSAGIWEALGIDRKLGVAYNHIGSAYLGLGKLEKAKTYLERGKELAVKSNWLEGLKDNAKFFSSYYETTGEFEKAMGTYKTYIELRDSIFDLDRQKELIQNELEYGFLQKEKVRDIQQQKVLALQKERSKQQWIVIFAVGAGFLMAILFLILLNRRLVVIQKQKRIIEEQRLTIEMEALRAQMNPHFIFNSLNSIKHFVIRNDTREAVSYLNKFARLVRLTLENSKQTVIPLESELEGLGHYLELESIRFDRRFSYTIENQLKGEQPMVPPLVLQPYVENAIWHGVMPLEKYLAILRSRARAYEADGRISDRGGGQWR